MPTARFISLMAWMVLCIHLPSAYTQRIYTNSSVLSSGNWYKIAVQKAGVYRIDLPFLQSLGISTNALNSASIKVYGNGGAMLPENNASFVQDDLQELSLWVADGGDGQLNGNDYVAFYAPGPHQWTVDTAGRSFRHNLNLYSNESFYYITIQNNGKRIAQATAPTGFDRQASAYQFKHFHETDTFNLLSSGKDWIGEEFAAAPGKLLVQQLPLPGALSQGHLGGVIRLKGVARAFGGSSQFTGRIAGQTLPGLSIPPVAAGPFDIFARSESLEAGLLPADQSTLLELQFTPGSANAQGWLDWFELIVSVPLTFRNEQMSVSDWSLVSPGSRVLFNINSAPVQTMVWDISTWSDPVLVPVTATAQGVSFVHEYGDLRQFQVFTPETMLKPTAIGRIPNQNLHGDPIPDYLVVSHPDLLPQANRLADFHRTRNSLRVLVVTTEQVYNEFSSGTPDPTAIRNFARMHYDRAGRDSALAPKYLLLFGDASFDYKDRIRSNTNLLPAYQSESSFDPLSTYTSDDFFGFLDFDEDINGTSTPLLDMAVGRIPAKSPGEAASFVDKLIAYHNNSEMGQWRKRVTLIADDEDNNLHLDDAESVATTVETAEPVVNVDKIYLDAFRQQSSPGGSTYPEANLAISNNIFNGTIIWNYSGHGSYRRLAEEVVLDQAVINTFRNESRLPLFVTATCDVAPFDNPLVSSIGENLLLREKTGCIALMTTNRLVFAFSNRVMNNNYMRVALTRLPNGRFRSLGDAARTAKNITYQFSGDVVNNRKFALLGDPAMTLAFPEHEVRLTTINGRAFTATPDTLKALASYVLGGEVRSSSGDLLTGFNGTATVTVFDKQKATPTLGNDPTSRVTTFNQWKNVLFRGKGRVSAGVFTIEFIVPKDIDYRFGEGRVSLYAEDGSADGAGVKTDLVIGGTGGEIEDKEGPGIDIFLNDERFVSGGITNESPILLVKLHDSSGINTLGSGVGHDLVAYLDNDLANPFVLNDYYESETDNFKRGTIRFQLPRLEEGTHTIRVKAWDVANNSNEAGVEFRIIKSEDFTLKNVLNYPNPFTSRTSFWFEHNRAGEELRISVQIYTVTGKLVKTLRSTIISTGNRSYEVEWDGTDEFGNRIARGVYIYNLKVMTSDGKSAQKLEKLYKL